MDTFIVANVFLTLLLTTISVNLVEGVEYKLLTRGEDCFQCSDDGLLRSNDRDTARMYQCISQRSSANRDHLTVNT